VQNGIPAVIAMQSSHDEAAILLAHEFYGALADGYPVDASLAEARKAISPKAMTWNGYPCPVPAAGDAAIFQMNPGETR